MLRGLAFYLRTKSMQVPLLDLSEQNAGLRAEIEAALGRILDANAFILGPEVAELEKELAEYCNTRHAITCASGSDALLLALMALGVGVGDEVITTPFSFLLLRARLRGLVPGRFSQILNRIRSISMPARLPA